MLVGWVECRRWVFVPNPAMFCRAAAAGPVLAMVSWLFWVTSVVCQSWSLFWLV